MHRLQILRWTGGCRNQGRCGAERNSIGCSARRHVRASHPQSKLWPHGGKRQESSGVGREDTSLPSVGTNLNNNKSYFRSRVQAQEDKGDSAGQRQNSKMMKLNKVTKSGTDWLNFESDYEDILQEIDLLGF